MDKEGALKRFKEVFDYLKDNGKIHSWVDFAKAIGVSKSYMSDAKVDRGGKFSEDFLERIADTYPDLINKEWLLTGEGKMEAIDKSMKPHYPAKVSAGVLAGTIENVNDYEVEYEPVIKRFPQYDFIIDVEGHSMEPTYIDKGMVACRKIYGFDEIKFGKAYVIATKDGAVLKRIVSKTLSSIRVVSDNPAPKYHPYNIDRDAILDIYEVVGSINVGNADRGYVNYVDKNMIKYIQSVIERNAQNHEKLQSEIVDLFRNMPRGNYSDD